MNTSEKYVIYLNIFLIKVFTVKPYYIRKTFSKFVIIKIEII